MNNYTKLNLLMRMMNEMNTPNTTSQQNMTPEQEDSRAHAIIVSEFETPNASVQYVAYKHTGKIFVYEYGGYRIIQIDTNLHEPFPPSSLEGLLVWLKCGPVCYKPEVRKCYEILVWQELEEDHNEDYDEDYDENYDENYDEDEDWNYNEEENEN